MIRFRWNSCFTGRICTLNHWKCVFEQHLWTSETADMKGNEQNRQSHYSWFVLDEIHVLRVGSVLEPLKMRVRTTFLNPLKRQIWRVMNTMNTIISWFFWTPATADMRRNEHNEQGHFLVFWTPETADMRRNEHNEQSYFLVLLNTRNSRYEAQWTQWTGSFLDSFEHPKRTYGGQWTK